MIICPVIREKAFSTQSGTIYFVDAANKTIRGGGTCPTPSDYDSLYVKEGERAFVRLSNGEILRTSRVTKDDIPLSEIAQKIELCTQNSTYLLDYSRNEISGGKLTEPTGFIRAEFKEGERAKIFLQNGQIMQTSPIVPGGITDISKMKNAEMSEPNRESLFDYLRN